MSWGETKEDKKQEVEFIDIGKTSEETTLNILIYGGFGTGKTHFALTAPEPIYIIDTEKGVRPLMRNFKNKQVFVLNCFGKTPEESYTLVTKAMENISTLAEEGKVGTVVFDSITDLWEISQHYAKTEIWKIREVDKLKQQWDWGTINILYYKILKKLLLINCNTVLTARTTEEYAGAGQPTGSYKPRCQKETGHWVNFVIENTTKIIDGKYNFISSIEKAKGYGELQGRVFNNLNFNLLKEEIKKLEVK